MASPEIPASAGGGAITRIQVYGVGYLWTGALIWGHEPYGQEPLSWTCERCGALTVDPKRHAEYHRSVDRVRAQIMRRLGLTDIEE